MPENAPLSSESAAASLDSIRRAQDAGLKRGLYPRWVAIAISLWAGALAATVATVAWLPLFLAGILAGAIYRRKHGAWVREITSRRDLWIVLVLGALLGAVFIAGYVGLTRFGAQWAPLAAGACVSVTLFLIMEITYAPVRARLRDVVAA